MKHTKINRFFLQTLAYAAGMISLGLFALPAPQAFADVPLLKPACYQIGEGVFIPISCATEGQARSVVSPLNKCFAGNDTTVLHEVSCSDGSRIGPDINPDGGTSGERGLNAVKNDCDQGANNDASNCEIIKYIKMFINVLSGAVGIVIVGSLIVAGLRYSTAGADPKKVSDAKNRILNTVIALTAYLFFFAFLQWIVPGGIL